MDESDDMQTLRVLGSLCPIRLGTFDDRLRMQKLAFLIQEVGGRSDFAYYWYVRGPYSPALTRALFSERGAQGPGDGTGLSDAERRLAGRVRSLVGEKTDDPLELELYASVWYLTPKRRLLKRDRASIATTMLRTKPYFTEEQVANTLSEIEAFRSKGRAP